MKENGGGGSGGREDGGENAFIHVHFLISNPVWSADLPHCLGLRLLLARVLLLLLHLLLRLLHRRLRQHTL
jgi:hypothetical protein